MWVLLTIVAMAAVDAVVALFALAAITRLRKRPPVARGTGFKIFLTFLIFPMTMMAPWSPVMPHFLYLLLPLTGVSPVMMINDYIVLTPFILFSFSVTYLIVHVLSDYIFFKRGNTVNYLVLVRHGQSQWNLENRFTGFHDIDLSDLGRQEAADAGARLKQLGVKFDAVFTSTLKRANNTAEIALKNAGQEDMIAKMVKDDDLRERDYGDLTGLNKDETRAKYGEEQVHIWRRSYDVAPPGGECLEDVVEKRVRPYYEANIKPLLEQGKNVLVAAHGNSLRALLIIIGAETPETINKAEMETGVPVVFELENGKITKRYSLTDKQAA